jgi:ACS family glucarate transporter-like MFS transporter
MTKLPLLAFLFVLSLITYVDRAAISSVKDDLVRDLALSEQQIGAVFSSFALGYALAQIPSGWLADKLGARVLLSAVVLLWSVLTGITGLLTTFSSLLIVRFAFGAAEAGAFPGSARAIFEWIPPGERGLANGVVFAGSRLGAALAFPLMAWLLDWTVWRNAFLWLALPGVLWGVVWLFTYKNNSAGNQSAAMSFHWSPKLFVLMLQYFIVNFTTYFCLTWMMPYLKSRFSLSTGEAATYTMVPLLVGSGAHYANGLLIDGLFRHARWSQWSRRMPAMIGFGLSAIGISFIPSASSIGNATFWFTVAAFGAEMVISPSWAYAIDLGKEKSGALSGAMNMAGNMGSFVSANAFPVLGPAYFLLVMGLNLVAACLWYFLKPETAMTENAAGSSGT